MQQSFRTGILSTTPSKKVRVKGGNHFVCANLDVFGTPQHQTQSRDEGVSLEYMVELSNVLEADMWYCIPHAADDDYVRKAAELIKEKLHPDRKLYWSILMKSGIFLLGSLVIVTKKEKN